MEDLRRVRLGEMFLDVTKYVLTIVVIGSLLSSQIQLRSVGLGIALAIVSGAIGYWLLSPSQATKEKNQ